MHPSPDLSSFPSPPPPVAAPAAPPAIARAPFLVAGLALALLLATPIAGQPRDLELEVVVEGLESPTSIVDAGDGRLLVGERLGTVRIVRYGRVEPGAFLDLRDRVRSGGERGLLSVALHPGHDVNGWLFVDYTDLEGDTVVSRFRVSPESPDRTLLDSERVLLRIPQPFANHNGGQLQFGPDGYLYVGTGDGGGSLDPLCNAQDPTSLLGKVLRLDVGSGPGDPWAAEPPWHRVPADNPFVGLPGHAPEVWSLGLRNPWRFSFDRATGDLYVADVGEGEREEVDFQAAATGGANYGWKRMEGTLCPGSDDGCGQPLPPCGAAAYTPPVLEYAHGDGRCSITGGHVYRGGRIAGLDGWYLYGDFCTGEVLATSREDGWNEVATGLRVERLTTFGEGRDGELYLAGLPGTLYRLAGPPIETAPCVEDGTTLCLLGDRFGVQATFRVGDGPTRQATAVPLTEDTGLFWFFDRDNLELVVKVLDGCPVNGRHWVFAAGLTNVAVEVVVRDHREARERSYSNPFGTPFAPVQDTAAFDGCF